MGSATHIAGAGPRSDPGGGVAGPAAATGAAGATTALAALVVVLRRRRRLVLATGAVLAAATVALAFGLPPVYRSTATILIEQQEIPQDLVRSTVTTYANQQIRIIQQRVMTTENLMRIVERYDLYAGQREREPLEATLARITRDIVVETVDAQVVDPRSGRATTATIAFDVSFRSRRPEIAQRVANELASLYLNENLRRRAVLTGETLAFLSGEARKLETVVADLEARLADFKERHAERLPERAELNIQLLDRTERERGDVERRIRALEERRIFAQAELARLGAQVAREGRVLRGDERSLDPRDRLRFLEGEHRRLSALYSPEHPDVVRVRRELEALRAEVGADADPGAVERRLRQREAELETLRRRYSGDHPDVRALERVVRGLRAGLEAARAAAGGPGGTGADPARVQLGAQLAAIEAELESLRAKRRELEGRVAEYERRIAGSPEVEREYRALARERDTALRKYDELKAKQLEAQLAEALESGRKGERFTLLEPPRLPEAPIRPDRMLILVLGLTLSAGGALGAGFLAESLDATVRDRRDVRRAAGTETLAEIPVIETPRDRAWRRLRRALALALAAAGVAAALGAVHRFWMPLDTAWFAIARRIGLLS